MAQPEDLPKTGEMLTLPDGRSVHFVSAGPKTGKPVAVLLHGLGGSTFEWVAVVRELAGRGIRVFGADRAGYWPSSPPAEDVQPTIPWLAQDLKLVLETAKVPPPYVLVGQSYGGDIARQCMLDWPAELIAGMVVVDSPVRRFNSSHGFVKMLGPDDYADVVGLAANRVLTPSEVHAMKEAEARSGEIQGRELATALADGARQRDLIGDRQLLGDKPISVMFCSTINDFQKIYDHGMQHGYGDEEARKDVEGCLNFFRENEERDMRFMLGYSSVGRYVVTEGKAATHNVHVVDPGVVAGEVEWVVNGGKG